MDEKLDVVLHAVEGWEQSESAEVRQLAQEVASATGVYERDGKPDLEEDQAQAAQKLGISEEGVRGKWKVARANRRSYELGMAARRLRGRKLGVVKPVVEVVAPAIVAQPPPSLLLPKNWQDLRIPPGLSDLERLTYVPGLVGDITEWIVSTARRPNRMMALAVALTVVGTICGRRVRGPTGSATHLYLVILGRTTLGKGHPMQSGPRLLRALGLGRLIGPSDFASGGGLERYLAEKPLMVMFIDELGDQLAKIKNQDGNVFVTDLKGILKRCWPAYDTWETAAKVHGDVASITWPALSICAAATWRAYFDSVNSGDFDDGFANRFLVVPVPYEAKRPPEERVLATPPPDELLAALAKLPQASPPALLDRSAAGGGVDLALPKLIDLGWTKQAEETYYAFSAEVDALEDAHPRYQLALRLPESAARIATDVALGCGREIENGDVLFGKAFAMESFKAHAGGADRFMREYLEFPEMCDRMYETILAAPKCFISEVNINRKFGRTQRWGSEIGRVLQQLIKEKRIEKCSYSESGFGRAAAGYRAIVEEE
jgi:hypothetical protein